MQVVFTSDVTQGGFRFEAGKGYDLDKAAADRFIAQGVARLVGGDSPFVYQDPSTRALVGAGGETIARTDLHPGADQMPGAVGIQSTSTAALSTTALIRFTPAGGVYRTVRLTWTNNGGPSNGNAYIAANCDNDARGLFASQQSQQRDASIAIGGAVLLVSPVPLESICVSADQAYSVGQHSLTCVFGE